MNFSIFKNEAFSNTSMTKALELYEFQPDLIGSLNIFENVETDTTIATVERRDIGLELIKTSPRGAPIKVGKRIKRNLRNFETVRIAKSATLHASEIQNMRTFGKSNELQTAINFISLYQNKLVREIEMTWENMQLGAIKGAVLDADGTVIYDWFKEWGIPRPKAINFDLDTENTNVEGICREIVRSIKRKAGNKYMPNSQIIALCGDTFFDKLTSHKMVRETYLNTTQAQNLNRAFGVATESPVGTGSFAYFYYGGIFFYNYHSIDDYDETAKEGTKLALGVKPNEAHFVPVNVDGVFQKIFAPGESWSHVNEIGLSLYSTMVHDLDREFWVQPEVFSYPLFICLRPEMLMKGVSATKK
ncbi:major capsid protein [Bartonella sp. B17]